MLHNRLDHRRQAHTCRDLPVGDPMSGEGRVAESAEAKRSWAGTMTYQVSEEGPVYQSDLSPAAQPSAVGMGWKKEACLATAQVANREAGAGVLRNNGSATSATRGDWESQDPWALHRPAAPWRSGPAWPPRDR